MADYKWAGQEETDGVIRLADGASIPNANGNKDWNDWKEYDEAGGVTEPWRTTEEEDEAAKQVERDAAEKLYEDTCSAPVTIDTITYKGGEASASGISGAVQLSQAGGLTTCMIADIYNVVREMSFEDALAVSGQIGMITYEAFIVRANTLAAINEV